nr:FAD binding domain-containing protein [Nocardioidaceae bacterium]
MYPAPFEYHAASSVEDALQLLGSYGDDAKLLAGGHSLIPILKLRFAQPAHLIDIRRIPGLAGIRQDGDAVVIGATTTH